jgi:glutamine amidotransferase
MITIVDYNAGNLRSVKRACDAVGIDSAISADPDVVARAERVIFPGVGAAGSAMETVKSRGLDGALREAVRRGTPVLGICIGCQIILDRSEEGDTPCLGLIPGDTVRFKLRDPHLKVPHIGWNEVRVEKQHPLLAGFAPGDELYFVHSFFPNPTDPARVYATADYGGAFCCALGRDNLFATQFHPEKSGPIGLGVLERFSKWTGTC